MKAKSMKLRTLITLHAIFKHSDKDHRMNGPKLNKYLEPYGLTCTSRVLNDTVRVMREYGMDIRNKGIWDNMGIWLEDRPLADPYLDRLVFAVTTNPHLSKTQATEILGYLEPLVTTYQEEKLVGTIDTVPDTEVDDSLYVAYSTVCEAIRTKRRVLYSTEYIQYNKDTQTVAKREAWGTLFTPKCIYQSDAQLFMFGYNNTDKKIQAIDLKDITDIKIAFKHQKQWSEKVESMLQNVDPKDYIPEEKEEVIYKGEVTFRCRGQFVTELYSKFGPPCKPVIKDARCRTEYTVQEAVITPKTLLWLSGVHETRHQA